MVSATSKSHSTSAKVSGRKYFLKNVMNLRLVINSLLTEYRLQLHTEPNFQILIFKDVRYFS